MQPEEEIFAGVDRAIAFTERARASQRVKALERQIADIQQRVTPQARICP